MKHLSLKLLSETVISRRKTMGLSQAALSKKANINRSILSRLETCDYSPSVDQLLSLSAALGFQPSDVIVDDEAEVPEVGRKKIGLSITASHSAFLGFSLSHFSSDAVENTCSTYSILSYLQESTPFKLFIRCTFV